MIYFHFPISFRLFNNTTAGVGSQAKKLHKNTEVILCNLYSRAGASITIRTLHKFKKQSYNFDDIFSILLKTTLLPLHYTTA